MTSLFIFGSVVYVHYSNYLAKGFCGVLCQLKVFLKTLSQIGYTVAIYPLSQSK